MTRTSLLAAGAYRLADDPTLSRGDPDPLSTSPKLDFAAMDAAGQRAWTSPEFTVSLSPGRPGVVITDPEAIPGAFMRVRREPDKTAIGAAIASGADIPGAEMRNGLPTLTIRTK